jgi:2-oxoglutarate ferredoxin oxidoreductase subunit beta
MNITDIINPANLVMQKTKVMNDAPMHYCPGCSHGVVHKIIGEIIEEMDIQDKTIGIAPVGCAVFAYQYLDIDWQQAAHGRAPALATAVKRLLPDRYVFTYHYDQYKKAEFEMEMKYRHSKVVDFYDEYYYKTK